MTRRSIVAAVALIACLGLTGCGSTPTVSPSAVASATSSASPATLAPSASPASTLSPVAEGVRHAALFGSARKAGGATHLKVDLVLFLTDGEAEDAAEAEGDEPPPNDFYILNHSKKLREYVVADGVAVSVVMDPAGDLCPDLVCPVMSLDAWVAAVTPTSSNFRSTPYWLTINDTTITAISQQYVP